MSHTARPHFNYVDDEASIPQKLTCGVCHDVAVTHRGCPQCKATFCKECMDQWFETQKRSMQPCSCPYCRRPLRYSQLRHDAALQAELDALLVKCPNTPAGCAAVTARSHMQEHLRAECLLQPVACPHCGVVALRWELGQHEGQCPAWPIACPNAAAGCTALVPGSAMQQHLDSNCMWHEAPCAACSQAVRRRDWQSHALQGCPAAQDCVLRPAGCGLSGDRQQVQQHQQAEGHAPAPVECVGGADVFTDDCGCLPDAERSLAEGGYVGRFRGTDSKSASSGGEAGPSAAPATGPDVMSGPDDGMLDWEDAVELGLPGCGGRLGIEGLASDASTDAAWRTVLNLGLVEAMSSDEALGSGLPARSMYLGLLRAWGTVAKYMDDVQAAWWSGRDMRAAARAARRAAAGRGRPLRTRRQRYEDDEAGDSDASSDYYQDIDDSDDWDPPATAGEVPDQPAAAEAGQQQHPQQHPSSRRQQQRHHGVAVGGGGRGHVHLAHHRAPGQQQQHHGPEHQAAGRQRRGFPLAVSGPAGGAAQGLDEDEREDLWGELGKLGVHEALCGLGARAAGALWARAGNGGSGERVGVLVDLSVACVVRDLEMVRAEQREQEHSSRRRRAGRSGGGGSGGGVAGGEDEGGGGGTEMAAISRVVEGFRGLPAAPGMHAVALSAAIDTGSAAAARGLARLRKRVAAPGGREGVSVAAVAEFLSARLLLDHFMAERIELTSIPTTNAHITHGWRAYWAPSLLRLAAARAPGAALSWRALSAANDMVSRLVGRVLSLMSSSMFDAGYNAVPVSGAAVLAALRLALPPALFEAVAPRARAAMARFKDVECDDLSSVTWARLAQQVGLTFELGKAVGVVDVALPLVDDNPDEEYEDDEDEDMSDEEDDDEDGDSSGSDSSGSYTSASDDELGPDGDRRDDNDDDGDEDDEDGDGGQQRGGARAARHAARNRGTPGRGRGRGRGARHGGASGAQGGGESAEWESASGDEQEERQGARRQRGGAMDIDRPAAAGAQGTPSGQRGPLPLGLGDLGDFLRRTGLFGGNAATGASSGSTNDLGNSNSSAGAAQAPSSAGAGPSGAGSSGPQGAAAATAVAAVAITNAAVAGAGGDMTAAAASAQAVAERLVAEGPALLSGPYEEVRERLRALPASPLLLAVFDFVAAPPDHVHRAAALQRIQQAAPSPSDMAQVLALQRLLAGGGAGGAGADDALPTPAALRAAGELGHDRSTEGVVVLTTALEVAMERLLGGALSLAQSSGPRLAAGASVPPLGGQDGDEESASVVVTSRDVLLAASRDGPLSEVLLGSGTCVVGAGVVPSVRRALLPDPAREPVAAALAALASLQPRHALAAGGGALVFPVDLRHYCGYGGSSSGSGGSGSGGSGGDSRAALRCCFFSGLQCARCSKLTAAAAGQSLDQRLEACRASLQRYLPAVAGPGAAPSGTATAGAVLSQEQLVSLMEGARLYHLQRAWWWDPELRAGASSREAADAVAASLPRIAELTLPLRDIEALRQVQEQQLAGAPAWPAVEFEDMVLDALDTVAGAAAGAGAGAGPGHTASSGGSSEGAGGSGSGAMAVDGVSPAGVQGTHHEASISGGGGGCFEFSPEALEALAAAADSLLSEQFAVAQGLSLRSGRQEVTRDDLRDALRLSGLGHLVPPRGTGGALEEDEEVLPGLL